ncbi:MAG TPA: VOC family protein [Pyrinomonadaceae bacterium]|nr:VOC family protein [Pyrinomonadaceae bacterium]
MATVRVRYIVNAVKAAIVFYSDHLGFKLDDLDAIVNVLRKAGARFRNNIVTGVGGKQIILEDPSGNPIELFQPIIPKARLK